MWPGQQPPGGENPQQPNPYQQQGQHPPNPYHQPGYQQPNPYAQPTVPQYAVDGQPPGPPGPSRDEKKRTTVVAIVAATAVVAAAVITGVVVLGKDEDGDNGKGSADKAAGAETGSGAPKSPGSPPPASAPAGGGSPSPQENPRSGEEVKPTVKGWKVVTNPKHGTRFDVPADWEIPSSGMSTYLEDQKKGGGVPLVTMSAPAHFKSTWCTADANKDGLKETSGLATAGTKGGKGAKDTKTAAYNEAGTWVWGAYAQKEPKGTVEITPAKPYTTEAGLSGSLSTATAVGVKKNSKCDTDGKSFAFTFKDATGEFRTWVLYANKGIQDEVPDTTIRRILSTLRTTGTSAD
ncbi:hypothetical protein [Streptomyces sp. NPDC014894]|uniref:hypothetical protein n=1 Tax=unclassified Streptomyces TaxID=2593676 RepID=UPI0036FED063